MHSRKLIDRRRGFMLLFVGLSSMIVLRTAEAHPQCLDFTFPFKPWKNLVLCSEYQAFGCCSRTTDHELLRKYQKEFEGMTAAQQTECGPWLRTLLCQKCSPYAAHIYDAEDAPAAKSFPGLCPDYCSKFLPQCPSLIYLFTNDTKMLNLVQNRNIDGFCQAITTVDRDYCYPDLLTNPELSADLGDAQFYQKAGSSNCIPICLKEIANRRPNPLAARHANDGTHRQFIVEQLGLIYILLPDNSRLEPPFLDLRDVVVASEFRMDERGMLDISFHPNYKTNGIFYLYYCISKRRKGYVKISEMKVSDVDMNKANVSSERTLLKILQPANNHNGGQLLFLEGIENDYLYIFTGDGGRAGDPFGIYGNGQNKKTLLGKVLRIDISKKGNNGTLPYSIPPDNPFVNDPEYLPEIYALGVRNMWRCSMDRGDEAGVNRGRIFCGDVGQGRYEEIDIIEKGANYGWRGYEGHACYDRKLCNTNFMKNYVRPIHSYRHSVGKSVTGGYVYRGCQNPNLRGKYIFGDFHNGKLFALNENSDGSWTKENICMASDEACKGGRLQNNYGKHILSFGESESGELYMMSTPKAFSGSKTGSVFEIVDPSSGGDPNECAHEVEETILQRGTRKILYEPASVGNIEVRLVDPNGSKHQGRVEILVYGEWGTICDDSWDIADGNVICKMLGFKYALSAPTRAKFGRGSGQIWLDEVECSGIEENVAQCERSQWADHNCGHKEDASVVCL